jgi:hypothetical protein
MPYTHMPRMPGRADATDRIYKQYRAYIPSIRPGQRGRGLLGVGGAGIRHMAKAPIGFPSHVVRLMGFHDAGGRGIRAITRPITKRADPQGSMSSMTRAAAQRVMRR